MSKRKQNAAQKWKSEPKLIKARHDEICSDFFVFTLGPDGKKRGSSAAARSRGSTTKTWPLLIRLADAVGGCEIKWALATLPRTT
jgi:hypothetical protein